MELAGIPTPCMDWNSVNLFEAFKRFEEHVQLVFDGALSGKTEEVKITYLRLWLGEKGREIYNTLTLTDDERKSLKDIWEALKKHVRPKSNPVFARYKFNLEMQNDATIEQFITRVKHLARECAFDDTYRNDMIRDRLVFGVKSQKIREKLLTEGAELKLEKAVQICQTYEYAQEQLKTMQGASNVQNVSQVRKKQQKATPRDKAPSRQSSQPGRQPWKPSSPVRKATPALRAKRGCYYCGQIHEKGQCPAKGKQCNTCKKWNHFATVCQSRKVNNVDLTAEEDSVFIDSVNSTVVNGQVFAEIEVGKSKSKIKFKLDTGAQVNILPYSVFQHLGNGVVLNASHNKLTTYNGGSLNLKGTVILPCTYAGNAHTSRIEFHVVDTRSPPLLGLQSCIDFGLIKLTYSVDAQPRLNPLDKESVLNSYPEVFKGIGSFEGNVSISLKHDAKPIVHAPRRVPVALRDRCKQELERMETIGVITKVDEPTDWVNSMVIVEKSSGQLRICLDPHDLNQNVQRPHYPIKTIDDILPHLTGAKFFTKLDARSGYWAIHLDEESSFLTTFNTCFGRYRYLRLPMGLKSSMDIFQRKIDESFESLPGVVAIVDDVLVYGKTREEHDRNLRTVLDRAFERGIRFNDQKLEVALSEVKYFGHLISAQGIQPDPAKVAAIRDMPVPVNRSELETWFGMVNYLSRFAQNLAEVTSPLRALLVKDVEFYWGKPQSDAFEKVKQIITQQPGQVLAYYDPDKPLLLTRHVV